MNNTLKFLAAMSSTIAVSTAMATDRYVNPDGVCGGNSPCYATIQDAIDAANAGDTIHVAAATYVESPNFSSAEPNITLLGPNAGIPGWDTGSRGSEAIIQGTVSISSSNVQFGIVIDGFRIESGNSSGVQQVRLDGGGVFNNVIRGDWDGVNAPNNRGIITASTSPVAPQQWALSGNDIDGFRFGIAPDGNNQLISATITNNVVRNCERGLQSFGAFHSGTPDIVISGNTFADNEQGIRLAGGHTTISGNIIDNNSVFGISPGAGGVSMDNLTIENNQISSNANGLIFVNTPASFANLSISCNEIVGNTVGAFSNSIQVDMLLNWWGDSSGPSGNGPGTGDSVETDLTGDINFDPWLTSPGCDPAIAVNADDTCYQPGDTVNVTVDLDTGSFVDSAVLFLSYDTSRLSLIEAANMDDYGGADFPTVLAFFHDDNAGTIQIHLGIEPGDPAVTGSAEMAVFEFSTLTNDDCDEADLVSLDTPTMTVHQGIPNVLPAADLNDLGAISLDGVGPTVEYADNTLDSTSGLGSGSLAGVVWRYADPGNCETVVNWDQPVAGVDYFDNCTADGDIIVDIISTFQPGDTLAAGQFATVTYRFTDACGNFTDYSFDVHVLPYSVAHLDIEIGALSGQSSVERCLEAVVNSTQFGVVNNDVVAEFLNGVYTDWTVIPCDTTCGVVRDPLHTLWAETTMTVGTTGHPRANSAWHVEASLTSGDLNGDNLIDILDFSIFVWQYVVDYGTGDTDCNTPFPHADMTGDGLVNSAEFTFISNQFLFTGDSCPLMIMAGDRGNMKVVPEHRGAPRNTVTVRELHRMGLGHLAIADINRDGVIDATDIALFLMNGLP